ncbi:MAG TPA: hydrogenase maturation protease [Deltaproteobacteria bacterium]|nr:hydrogenase maturation protease [Deltaproteobacteria bacterium]
MNQRLVIGIGNEFRRDDAVGLIVLRRLRERNLPLVTLAESSGEGTQLMDLWKDASEVILVDAISSGRKAGSIQRFEAHRQALPAQTFRYSTHAFSLGEAIELARAMNQLPPSVIVYGIEGKDFGAGVGLTQEVEEAVEAVLERILIDL